MPARQRNAAELSLAVVAAVAAVTLVAVPLARLGRVVSEAGGESVRRVFHTPGVGTAAVHSVVLACIVPLIAVPVGNLMALLLQRSDVAWRGLLRVLIVLPLVIPQFVLGYSWTQAYGQAGFTDQLFGLHWNGLNGAAGIVVVLAVDAAPLSFLLTSLGLATRAAPELEQAARCSGSGEWGTLRTVTIPLLRPVIAAELVLTFVSALESFAVPQVLGAQAGFETITTRIYGDLALASEENSFVDAVTLALALVVVAVIVLLPADLMLAPALKSVATGQPSTAAPVGRGGRSRRRAAAPATAVFCYSVLAVGLPSAALVSASITRTIGLAPTPSNWTLDNFRTALDAPTIGALRNSLQLAVWAAFALTGLGAVVVALERRRAGRAFATLAMMSFAIPGSTLAVGLLIAYGRWLDGSLLLILIAYLAKFWALAHRAIEGPAARLPHGEWQAARASAAGPVTAARTIWLPSLAPALLGAWLLVFLAALHEVTMSSLLYSSGNQTLAVAVLNSQELGAVGPTAALSVTLTLLVMSAAAPTWWFIRMTSRRRTASPFATARGPAATAEVAGAR